MIREYIINLAADLNKQYPGILSQNKINRAIEMFEKIDKPYEVIIKEIEALKEKLIKDYLEYIDANNNDDRNSRTFSQIKEVQSKVQNLLDENEVKIFISGGSVPYLIMKEDSDRLHDDIDTVCRMEDIDKLRDVFIKAGLHNPEWDSKNFSEDGMDYGFEMKIDGVPFGIYPFEYNEESKVLTQYSMDPYNKLCKTKTIPITELSDYIMSYKGLDGKIYDTMSLEYIKLTKDMAGREKDIADSKKIEKTGLLRPEVMARVKMYDEKINKTY